MNRIRERLDESFKRLFGSVDGVRYFFAPGRVNLMGDHVDYNGGMTLPCAIPMGTFAAVRKNKIGVVRMYSNNFPECGVISSSLSVIKYDKGQQWGNYPLGVLEMFFQSDRPITDGLDIVFDADLPAGSGLSSSASIEVLTATICCALFGYRMTPTELALLAQKAENEFVGMNCGIMDQLAIAAGREGNVLYMDTSVPSCEYAPLSLGDYALMIMNSNKKRALNESKYNERRAECEKALALLQSVLPKKSLCDVTVAEFTEIGSVIKDEVLYRRARHAITENERTRRSYEELKKGNIEAFGRLMAESHASLRDDYETTGREMDVLADFTNAYEGALGARATGAGFGGCVVGLVRKDRAEDFKKQLAAQYKEKTGLTVDFYEASAGAGPAEL